MRLLSRSDGTLSVSQDITPSEPYAILSHTSHPDGDVSFQDIEDGRCAQKASFAKVDFCLKQAARDGLTDVWIDSCCIDRRNNTELGEALNSMFRWYEGAEVCYVYLADVKYATWRQTFPHSRWFTRGWTLQELLAPNKLQFFSSNGHLLGDKISLRDEILAVTTIDLSIPLHRVPFVDRYEWSLNRRTLKPEDKSYCLIGLLRVYLQPQYGENEHASWERLLDAFEREHGRSESRKLQRARIAYELESQGALVSRPPRRSGVYGSEIELMNALRIDEVQHGIGYADPETGTCTLRRKVPAYKQWSTLQGSSVVLLEGRGGTERSTLTDFMKVSDLSDCLTLSFTFATRTSARKNSMLSFYQSLLLQIMDLVVDIRPLILSVINYHACSADFTENVLHAATITALLNLKTPIRIRCFIAEVDQCRQAYELMRFFSNIGIVFELYTCVMITMSFGFRAQEGMDLRIGGTA